MHNILVEFVGIFLVFEFFILEFMMMSFLGIFVKGVDICIGEIGFLIVNFILTMICHQSNRIKLGVCVAIL